MGIHSPTEIRIYKASIDSETAKQCASEVIRLMAIGVLRRVSEKSHAHKASQFVCNKKQTVKSR